MKFFALSMAAATLLAPAAMADPVAYDFDRSHTEVSASWDHNGFSRQTIQFTDFGGDLMLDFDDPTNSAIDITFNLIGGIWVGAHHDRFLRHLNSGDFFETEVNPTARFVATSFETEDGVTGVMAGDLTMNGMTHPVSLDVTLNHNGPHPRDASRQIVGVSASGTLLRSEWDMGFAAPMVSDEIQLSIEAEMSPMAPENSGDE